ncbi:hypothetical protein CDAR_88601 [Caerostris darwini]|uniref:Uncharacterized protein n=1 Tax=Caerostris darwini TaxID=1538125 RepID=A0AAV4NKP3_9ARAC|nr:hypothetical protein CDAR_88601 [Caerostris darwini]
MPSSWKTSLTKKKTFGGKASPLLLITKEISLQTAKIILAAKIPDEFFSTAKTAYWAIKPNNNSRFRSRFSRNYRKHKNSNYCNYFPLATNNSNPKAIE